MSWTLSLVMEASLYEVRRAAAIFREAIAGTGTARLRQELELAFVEACTNSVKHGSRDRKDAAIRIAIEVDARAVKVVFEDDGEPFDPHKKAALVEARDIASLPTGGMGLTLICEIFDSVKNEPRDGKNRLVLEKRLAATAKPAATAGARRL
jgi:anti-sigma regulatory factor (Ser/Thr protein kinase)